MSETVLVCGSVAFDTIAVFEDHFNKHILPDNIQSLSVSFFVPSLRKEYGGCAGNISYNLKKLGGDPVPVGTVGMDADDYLAYMRDLGIDTRLIRVVSDMFTPQCFITTDLDNNQIASFHPGAMLRSAENDLSGQDAAWGIVAPDSKDAMFAHARRMHEQGIPFVFDLGQAMPLFEGQDINDMIALTQILTANEYEASVVEQRTGRSMKQIATDLQAVVVTHGAQGATLYENNEKQTIKPVTPASVVDPTGCGDAHRAGLLYGLTKGWSLYEACCLANIMGSIKIASKGPQNHDVSRSDITMTLKQHYGLSRSL